MMDTLAAEVRRAESPAAAAAAVKQVFPVPNIVNFTGIAVLKKTS